MSNTRAVMDASITVGDDTYLLSVEYAVRKEPEEKLTEWWDWCVERGRGDPVAEGVSWKSIDEARNCAEAVFEVVSGRPKEEISWKRY